MASSLSPPPPPPPAKKPRLPRVRPSPTTTGDAACSECGRRFATPKALHGHMRTHPNRPWRGMSPPTPQFRRFAAAMEQHNTEEDLQCAHNLLLLAAGGASAASSPPKCTDSVLVPTSTEEATATGARATGLPGLWLDDLELKHDEPLRGNAAGQAHGDHTSWEAATSGTMLATSTDEATLELKLWF